MARYGLNKFDVFVSDVELKNVTRAEQLFSELHGRSLRGSLTVNVHKKYVVLTEGADGLAGVFVQWRFLDLPVDRINDWGDKVSIMTEEGAGLTLCICAKAESKPVVAFTIDQDALDRKEMVFNVI